MKIFQRTQALVQAFKLPMWGQFADETPPKWLVTRIQNEDLHMNSLGGLTAIGPFGMLSCAAGDYVLLTEQDTIEFCKPEDFDANYEVLDPKEILKAA